MKARGVRVHFVIYRITREWTERCRELLCWELLPPQHTNAQHLADFRLVRLIIFQRHNAQQLIWRDLRSFVSTPNKSCFRASILESIHDTVAHQTSAAAASTTCGEIAISE